MSKLALILTVLLVGCANGGYYRQPSSAPQCAPGKKLTKGNCGTAVNTTPQEGTSCSSDYNCTLGQFCRKAGYSYTGVCVNKN